MGKIKNAVKKIFTKEVVDAVVVEEVQPIEEVTKQEEAIELIPEVEIIKEVIKRQNTNTKDLIRKS